MPLTAGLIWYRVVYGSYRSVEKVLIGMALAFLAYPASTVIARPDWSEVVRGLVPRVRLEPEFLAMAVALLGTTITPYMQVFRQSSVVDKGVTRPRYGAERADAYLGSAISNLVSGSIIGLILFAAIALILGLPVIDLLVRLQVLNGLLLPFVLFFVLRLANGPKLMGRLKNNLAENAVGRGSLGLISLAAAIYLATQLGPILGPH